MKKYGMEFLFSYAPFKPTKDYLELENTTIFISTPRACCQEGKKHRDLSTGVV
jgi:hypothetical protein